MRIPRAQYWLATLLGGMALCAAGDAPPRDLPELDIESATTGSRVTGEVRGELPFALPRVSALLASPAAWCDIVVLHFNVKACVHGTTAGQPWLRIHHGSKRSHGTRTAAAVVYAFRARTKGEWLEVTLRARDGTLGTRDHRLRLTARAASRPATTTLRFAYALRTSGLARHALRAYLATAGRDKCGFTMVAGPGGQQCIGGLRGIVERNAVRYYYAVVAVLEGRERAAGDDAWRAARWFDLTAAHPRQLHELPRREYLAQKLEEMAAQRALQAAEPRADAR